MKMKQIIFNKGVSKEMVNKQRNDKKKQIIECLEKADSFVAFIVKEDGIETFSGMRGCDIRILLRAVNKWSEYVYNVYLKDVFFRLIKKLVDD